MATDANKKKQSVDNSPEHIPVVSQIEHLQQLKEDARDLAKKMKDSGQIPEPIIVTEHNGVKKVSDLTLDEKKHEIVRCASNPIYFIETYLTVFDQTQGEGGQIVPFKLFIDQKELIRSYLDHRFVIANKYRQAGISTTTCAYIAWYVMFKKNRSVAIVANKLETARDELMSDVVDFIDGCPDWLRPKPTIKDTQKLKRYDNNCQLGAFSSSGLRGYTPTLLFWDETAWTEKSDIFWLSAAPTLQTGGRAIFVSTPSGLDAVFYKTFEAARRGDSNFHAVELWWFNDPRYNEDLEWVKNKDRENEVKIKDEGWSKEHRIRLHDEGWKATSPWFEEQVKQANGDMRKIAQELLCSFLGSGDNFIAEEYLEKIEENQIKTPIRQEFTDNNFWIWEDPIAGEEYLVAIDASSGHGDDFSSINVLKIKEIIEDQIITKNGVSTKIKAKIQKTEQVGEYYGKVTPQMLAEIAYQYSIRYNHGYVVVDITNGYGVQTVEKLIEIGYPDESIHYAEVNHKPSRDRLYGYIKKGQKNMPDGSVVVVDLIPGFFIGNNRPSVLIEMQRAINLGNVIIRSIRLSNELKTFVTVAGNRVADHKRTFHDDSIMSLAVGLYVLRYDLARFRHNAGATKKMLDAMLMANDPEKMKERMLKEKAEKEAQEEIEGKKSKPIPPPHRAMNPDLQKHIANEWLFHGIKRK